MPFVRSVTSSTLVTDARVCVCPLCHCGAMVDSEEELSLSCNHSLLPNLSSSILAHQLEFTTDIWADRDGVGKAATKKDQARIVAVVPPFPSPP